VILLDTNVVSEIMRTAPTPAVINWLSGLERELYSSTITLAEILYGVELLPVSKRRTELLAGAEKMLTRVLVGRILAFDGAAARSFAHLASERRRLGRPISELDAQIAAIAQVHNATLATRNIADFEGCGIRLVNPWLD